MIALSKLENWVQRTQNFLCHKPNCKLILANLAIRGEPMVNCDCGADDLALEAKEAGWWK